MNKEEKGTVLEPMREAPWESFFVWLPRKIDGEWCWLSRQERRCVFSGCGLYGDVGYEYRIDTGDESIHHYMQGGDCG